MLCSRLATLSLDRLHHRGLLAADVSTGAAPLMEFRNGARRIGLKRGELALQDRAAAVILVAEIDVNGVDADRPRGDDRAFEESMRIALEIIAILEGARLSLVDVDSQQARGRFAGHDPPLPSGWKAGAAQAAKA
jgi:hypothetical protein